MVEPEDPPQLLDRRSVLVDAEVDEGVRERRIAGVPLDDEQCGGLLPATVAPCGLRGGETVDQPVGEGSPCVAWNASTQRVHRLAGDEDVALRRIAVPGPPAGPFVALGAGVRGAAPRGVDHPELALGAIIVGRRQALDDLLGRGAARSSSSPSGP